ncbi:MAG: hypothetical protein PVI70_19420 [Gammaproteobacteria bacterium]|jgi:hypothetical protein
MRTLLSAAVSITLAAGCQAGWTRRDGAAVDASRLEQALKVCRVERKLAGLERARDERDRGLRQAGSNQATTQVKEDFAAIERQVQAEIDACMQQQGYARKG